MKKNIVWLASYPKSGNTWFRIFLSNLRSNQTASIDINELKFNGIFSSKVIFEKATGVHADDLTVKEVDIIRSDVYRYYSSRVDDLLFIKAHDAYTYLPDAEPIFPANASYGGIYFVRNPLDVAVSIGFHSGIPIERAHLILNKNEVLASPNQYQNQLRQELLTWSEHVNSWISQKDIPIIILRYEDMKIKPLETFRKAIKFLDWNYSDDDIQIALDKSNFNSLRNQEQIKGFKERGIRQKKFFRSGKIGDWKNYLNQEQIKIIKSKHQSIMERLEYL